VTQVARGVGPGGGSRPGVALPIRIHDLLLALAGRVDDDALGDVRQMLASAELDRSLEFLAGCVAAGRIVLTQEQHRELAALFADTYLDPSVIDRVLVADRDNAGRHRFAIGAVDGRDPDRGVAEAVRPVLDVLPDVRSMWCVWRLTPSGPASGPVPHLLVLVGIGPGGFPPATAYRVEYALRRAGIRASVEVLMDGVEPGDYHREAMRSARQVPFEGHGSSQPRLEPADRPVTFESSRPEPVRIAPARVSAVPPPEPPRVSVVPPPEPPRMEPPPRVEPPRVEPPRVEAPRIDPPHVELPVRKDPPFGVEPPRSFTMDPPQAEAPRPEPQQYVEPPRVEPPRVDPPRVDPPTMMTPASGGLIGAGGIVGGDQEQEPPPRIEAVRSDPFTPVEQPAPQFEQERLPAEPPVEQPASALREEARTDSAPPPPRRSRSDRAEDQRQDEPPQEHPSRPRLAPAGNGPDGVDKHSAAFVDDILNTQERNLLRELQDELARREQQESPPSGNSGSWRIDRSGRHGKPATAGPFDHPNQTTGPMIINGVPPHPENRGYPPAN